MYSNEIFRSIGINESAEKRYVDQSGRAKSIDFEKTISLLNLITLEIERVHQSLLYFASLYLGLNEVPTINYSYNFGKDSLEDELNRLYQLLSIANSEKLHNTIIKKIINKSIELEEKEKEEIFKEIDEDGFNTFSPGNYKEEFSTDEPV
jgi:hypothetical protein